jgi:hypothetical protein
MRERILLPLVLVASLAVGAVTGAMFVRESPGIFSASPAPAATTSHTIDPYDFPPVPAKTVAALHALGTAQTKSDVFPVPSFITATHVDPATTHRVLTTGDGSVLWIGRTSQRLCLLFTSSDPAASGTTAASSCQTLQQFAESGLVLREGNDGWTWDGRRFTTTISH